MTYAAIIVLAFVIIAQCFRIWVQDDAIAHLERQCRELERISHDAFDQRDEARQRLAHLNERVGAYLKEATMLVAENERLKRGDGMDSDAIISRVEEWLEGENVV